MGQRNFVKGLCIIVCLLTLFISSCTTKVPNTNINFITNTTIIDNADIDKTPYDLPEKIDLEEISSGISVSGTYNHVLSHIGSFAQIVEYESKYALDEQIKFSEIMTYSELATTARNLNSGLTNSLDSYSIIKAAENLGISYNLMYSPNNQIYDFIESANELTRINTFEKALDNLKSKLDEGHPVIIYLDTEPIYVELAQQSTYWQNKRTLYSGNHYFTVFDYDEEYIFIKDPAHPYVKEFALLIKTLEKAWNISDKIGSYFMLSINDFSGQKKTLDEILEINKNNAFASIPQIKLAKTSDEYYHTYAAEFAKSKELFAEFLEEKGFTGIALKYKEASKEYISFLIPFETFLVLDADEDFDDALADYLDEKPQNIDFEKIAQLEEDAWNEYKVFT